MFQKEKEEAKIIEEVSATDWKQSYKERFRFFSLVKKWMDDMVVIHGILSFYKE